MYIVVLFLVRWCDWAGGVLFNFLVFIFRVSRNPLGRLEYCI